MSDRAIAMLVFVACFCLVVHLARSAWRAALSPEFRRDLHRLREQRRIRRSARRRK